MALFKRRRDMELPPPPPPPLSAQAPIFGKRAAIPPLPELPELPEMPYESEALGEEKIEIPELRLPTIRLPPKEVEEIPRPLEIIREKPLEATRHREEIIRGKSVFVRAEGYKEVLDSVTIIRNKINESEQTLARLNEIKIIADREFEKWRKSLEDIHRKAGFVDGGLFERVI